VLEVVKNGLCDLLANDRSMIDEMIDIRFISEQLEKGAYDWDRCFRLVKSITSIIKQKQNQDRIDETNILWEATNSMIMDGTDMPAAFCNALRFIFDRVNMMRVDNTNARLRYVEPAVRFHG
jgi:hypothetical protein